MLESLGIGRIDVNVGKKAPEPKMEDGYEVLDFDEEFVHAGNGIPPETHISDSRKPGMLGSMLDYVKKKSANLFYGMMDLTTDVIATKFDNDSVKYKQTLILGSPISDADVFQQVIEKLTYMSYRHFKVPLQQGTYITYQDTSRQRTDRKIGVVLSAVHRWCSLF